MDTSNPNSPDRPGKWVGLLRCLKCGNTVECRPADLLRFTQTKWLRCCDEVMTLFTPEPPGKPNAT
jgi:hypothetical protein